MKDKFLKIAGVKNEKEFYSKFPTEESFMAKHGAEVKKLQWGGVTATSLMPKNQMPNTDITLPEGIQGVSGYPQQPAQGEGMFSQLGGSNTITDLVQGFQMLKNQKQQRKKAEQWKQVTDVVLRASNTRPQEIERNYVRPEDNTMTGEELFPIYGTGSNVLKNGGSATEKANWGSMISNFASSGGGNALSSIYTGIRGESGGGKIGGTIGGVAGSFFGPVGSMVGQFAGTAIGELVDRNAEKLEDAQDAIDLNVGKIGINNAAQRLQRQNFSAMENGGNTSSLNGYITPLWGGYAETLSHNPFLPGNGETVMFRGQSHDKSDGKGNTGIGINYGGNAIEVESGEPALQLKNGSSGNDNLVVYGNVKINDEFSSLLGDPDAKGKKFKSYVADLSEQEKKSAKILDKSTEEIDTMEVVTPYDKLKMSSMEANVLGSNMKLKDIANKKMNAAFLQQAINDNEEENKLKITDDGDVKKAKKGITQAQNGIVSDEDYDYLVGLYQKAMAQGEGDAVEFFQKEFSRLAPERAKSILANYPVTNYGKANNMTNAELQSNYDAIFGKRTRQYIPDKAREMSDLGITPIEEAGIMPGEKEVVTDIYDPGYKRSAILDVASQVIPYLRPSDAERLDPRQLAGEMYALSNNQLEPVQAQSYNPQLATPYEVSFQDVLNRNSVDSKAAQRLYGYNPAAQSLLSAQEYQANQSVLGEQFRTNQAMRDQVYTGNRNTLNDAQIKNLGIFDQQYQRQEQAKSNTKATAQGAISSIADKYLQNQLENRTLQTYENLYGYRFGNNMRAINMNAPYQFDIPTVGAMQDVDENGNVVVTNSEKTSTIRDAFGRPKGSRQTSETKSKKSYKNGSIVKEIHNL